MSQSCHSSGGENISPSSAYSSTSSSDSEPPLSPPNEVEVFSEKIYEKHGIRQYSTGEGGNETVDLSGQQSRGARRRFPGYSKDSIQKALDMLSSRTTEFSELVNLWQYRDRTSVFDLTSLSRFLLFRTPSGHGKTSTLSMISHFYDILHKDDFSSVFRYTEIGQRIHEDGEVWEHSSHLVLDLDFEDLDVTNFVTEVNKALQDFAVRYKSHFGEHDPSSYTRDNSVTQTFENITRLAYDKRTTIVVCIDNYDSPWWKAYFRRSRDEIRRAGCLIAAFLNQLASWNGYDGVVLIALAGKDNVLNWIPDNIADRVYDVVSESPTGLAGPVLGLTKEDILHLAKRLHLHHHSLGLQNVGKDYLDSEEGIGIWKSSGQYYGFSFRKIHGYFYEKLEKAAVGVEGSVPSLSVPL